MAPGRPPVTDTDEPRRVGEAARLMNLKHAVVTMVARDDLPDGGAEIVADQRAVTGVTLCTVLGNGKRIRGASVTQETLPRGTRLIRSARAAGPGAAVGVRGKNDFPRGEGGWGRRQSAGGRFRGVWVGQGQSRCGVPCLCRSCLRDSR